MGGEGQGIDHLAFGPGLASVFGIGAGDEVAVGPHEHQEATVFQFDDVGLLGLDGQHVHAVLALPPRVSVVVGVHHETHIARVVTALAPSLPFTGCDEPPVGELEQFVVVDDVVAGVGRDDKLVAPGLGFVGAAA